METPIYSFQSADGLDRDVSPVELQDWVRSGKLKLDDTVTNFFSGQRLQVREILQDAPTQYSVPPTATPAHAAYPRESVSAPTSADLAGFNWGAFQLNWIWGINHKKYSLIGLILLFAAPYGPILVLALMIYAGINGNKWAWESGRFASVEEMRKCQKIWEKWARPLFVLWVCLMLVSVLVAVESRLHH